MHTILSLNAYNHNVTMIQIKFRFAKKTLKLYDKRCLSMIILDGPYISDLLLNYLKLSQEPVLKNEFTLALENCTQYHLVDDDEAIMRYAHGERIYTTSENNLTWLYQHLPNTPLTAAITTMKDKAKLRKLLKPLYPNFFFREIPYEELSNLTIDSLPTPCILKPSIGFFSVGVYTIHTQADLQKAIADINKNLTTWQKRFPSSVVGSTTFILEEYINGTEFAIDAYYDDNGEPVILNIFTHRFASADDVSDRIYYTSKEIIETYIAPFKKFLQAANTYLQIKNFAMHVEVRTDGKQIIPIEFNPMRFAGLCTTELAYHAYGIYTPAYFLQHRKPDFTKLLTGKEHTLYSLILLDKPHANIPSSNFDYDRLLKQFNHVLELRKVEQSILDIFGFLFTETKDTNTTELDTILTSDLTDFIHTKHL